MGTILAEYYKIIESIEIMQTFVQNGLTVTALREKCSNTEFFWSVFSRIRTEYGDLLRKSLYCVNLRIQSEYGKMRTRKNLVFGHFSNSAGKLDFVSCLNTLL